MIFVTFGTTKYPFTRAVKLIDQAMSKLKSNEEIIIQGLIDGYQPDYRRLKIVPNLEYDQFIRLIKESRLTITHGGASSIYLALQYSQSLPVIIPRLSKLKEHINDHQLIYSRLLNKTKRLPVILNDNNALNQIICLIQKPAPNQNHRLLQPSHKLTRNLVKFTKTINKPTIITIVFTSFQYGGVEIKIIDTINNIFKYYPRTKVHLILSKPQISLELVKKLNAPTTITSPPRLFNFLPKFIYFPLFLTYQFLITRPDKVLAFMDGNVIMAYLAKLLSFSHFKLIASEDTNTITHLQTRKFYSYRSWIIQKVYSRLDRILTITRNNKQNLIKLGISASKIIITPQWLSYVTIPLSGQIPPFAQRKYDILFVGRFDQQKDPLRFIRLCHALPNRLKILIIGHGPLEAEVRKLVDQLHLDNINIIKPNPHIYRYYRQSRLLVSTSKYEGYPLVFSEAISQGCLPIAPDIKDISWYFNKYCQHLIYHTDQKAITLIQKMLSSPSLHQQIICQYSSMIHQERLPNLRYYLRQITSV